LIDREYRSIETKTHLNDPLRSGTVFGASQKPAADAYEKSKTARGSGISAWSASCALLQNCAGEKKKNSSRPVQKCDDRESLLFPVNLI
jgi:hypothetical protein